MTKDELNRLGEIAAKSTDVVYWYTHESQGQVRGPHNRWFQCTGGDDRYTASIEEDIYFAAAAMNSLKPLLDHVNSLEKTITDLKINLSMEEELLGKV